MKKSSSKSLTFALALSMVIIILASESCSSTKSMPVVQSNDTTSFIQRSARVDTLILRDTVYRHDSIIYRERTIHDTVYITKEVYRDALNSKFKIQNSTKTDTVVVTEYRDRVIDPPPERYIPPFYKRCTTIFWIMLSIGVVYIIGKWYMKWRL